MGVSHPGLVYSIYGETFCEFVEKSLVPQLKPFNGRNACSVVVMDNCTVHHVPDIADMIEQAGALLQFLPPYSLDIN